MYGNILIIVNPAARNGKASQIAAQMASIFNRIKSHAPEKIKSYTFHYTVAPNDATNFIRSEAASYQTVLTVGGDGIVNEAINGLMTIPETHRPCFGLIPFGNGDDFGRTIGMNRNPVKSLQQLESHTLVPKRIDVARANDRWYIETLSFGLDAAIALDTQKLRTKTKRTGTSLYLQCGLEQLRNHRDVFNVSLKLDGQETQSLTCYLLAIQNGISYGGGFKICPQAHLNDGLLDICYVTPPLSFTAATKLLLKAKEGKHVEDPHVHFAQTKHIQLSFKHPLPSQIDGESFGDTNVTVDLSPGALKVLMP